MLMRLYLVLLLIVSCGAVQANSPPSVSFTAPANGSQFEQYGGVQITVDAFDPDGNLKEVAFYVDGVLIRTDADSADGYSAFWFAGPGGTQRKLRAVAKDRKNLTASAEIQINEIPRNISPVVRLVTPVDFQIAHVGTSLQIYAESSDSDGSVQSTRYYVNNQVVAAFNGPGTPFSYPLTVAGDLIIYAESTDNRGATGGSGGMVLNVQNAPTNTPPILHSVSPNQDVLIQAQTSLSFVVSASDNVGVRTIGLELSDGRTVAQVSVQSIPATVTWANVPEGEHEVRVSVSDDAGLKAFGPWIKVRADAPPASTLNVSNSTIVVGDRIDLTATVSTTAAGIRDVSFYNGTILIGTKAAPPYVVQWTSASTGTFNMTAKATSNWGTSATSAVVPVTVSGKPAVIGYVFVDELDTPRLITDSASQPVWEWPSGDPFGYDLANADPRNSGAKTNFGLRMAGQHFDSETGLHYNYFRDYDPRSGRYMQSDPAGLGGGSNGYAYVNGNPLGAVDPFGLQAVLPGMIPVPGVTGPSDTQNRALAESLARTMKRTGPEKTYQTYTRYNPRTNQCYTGMTSGYGTPEQNVRKRNANQGHLNSEGFDKGIVDQSSSSYLAIRGREQQVIDVNGGAQSSGGYSRNKINSVNVVLRPILGALATGEFGEVVKSGQCTCNQDWR